MHISTILHQLLAKTIHKTRIQSLLPVITGIILSKQLRLTQLGRNLDTPGQERSAIRRVDRLLANTFYQQHSINHARGYREPWILVSSLKGFSGVNRVIKIYKFRMTIEGSFRDQKSTQFGLSMNDNVTLKAERYIVWLLLASLASFIAWVVGYAAEQKKLHYDFQANTYRHRRVLSFFYLDCQIIRKK